MLRDLQGAMAVGQLVESPGLGSRSACSELSSVAVTSAGGPLSLLGSAVFLQKLQSPIGPGDRLLNAPSVAGSPGCYCIYSGVCLTIEHVERQCGQWSESGCCPGLLQQLLGSSEVQGLFLVPVLLSRP